MPTARMDLSTSAIGGRIYAIGGRDRFNGVSMSIVEVYDTGFVSSGIDARGKLPTKWGEVKSD